MSVVRRRPRVGRGCRLPIARVSGDSDESEKFTELPNANSTPIDSFLTWLEERRDKAHPYPLHHAWSHRNARKRFARSKDVDRYYWDTFDKFTTVLLTRTADESTAGLIEQSESFNPRAYKAKRRRLLKSLSDDYAGVSCMAPKYDLPMANSTVLSHVHEAYWIEGHHSAEDFEPLLDKHRETVPGATTAHVSVQHHSADSYPCLTPQSETDAIRGATTALPYELAENLPLMNVATDASDLHDTRALEWCARLSAGSDGDHSTKGVRRWQPFGQFRECADTVKDGLRYKVERDYRRTVRDEKLNNPWLSPQPFDEPESSPRTIPKPAGDALIQAVAQFARMPDLPPHGAILKPSKSGV